MKKIKNNIINLSRGIKLVQAFEMDCDKLYEYQELIFSDQASGRVYTISLVDAEITSENLRTAADRMDNYRMKVLDKSS